MPLIIIMDTPKAYVTNGKIHYSRPERVGIFDPEHLNKTEGDCFDASLGEYFILILKFGNKNFRWCHGMLRNNEEGNLIKGQGQYLWHCWIENIKLNKIIDTQCGSKAMWDKDFYYKNLVVEYKSYDMIQIARTMNPEEFKEYVRKTLKLWRQKYPE